LKYTKLHQNKLFNQSDPNSHYGFQLPKHELPHRNVTFCFAILITLNGPTRQLSSRYAVHSVNSIISDITENNPVISVPCYDIRWQNDPILSCPTDYII